MDEVWFKSSEIFWQPSMSPGSYITSARQKIQRRRFIISERFRERRLDLFSKLAKVAIKDATEAFSARAD
jgi:hypothetical protein